VAWSTKLLKLIIKVTTVDTTSDNLDLLNYVRSYSHNIPIHIKRVQACICSYTTARITLFIIITVAVNVTLFAGQDVDSIKAFHRLKQPNSVTGNATNCIQYRITNNITYFSYNIDVDECAVNNGGCSQICNNIIGGFSCECYTGYQQNQLDTSSCYVPGKIGLELC